jgi:hypothetical protein
VASAKTTWLLEQLAEHEPPAEPIALKDTFKRARDFFALHRQLHANTGAIAGLVLEGDEYRDAIDTCAPVGDRIAASWERHVADHHGETATVQLMMLRGLQVPWPLLVPLLDARRGTGPLTATVVAKPDGAIDLTKLEVPDAPPIFPIVGRLVELDLRGGVLAQLVDWLRTASADARATIELTLMPDPRKSWSALEPLLASFRIVDVTVSATALVVRAEADRVHARIRAAEPELEALAGEIASAAGLAVT